MVRDVDSLQALPDEKIKQQDMEYLSQHKLEQLMSGVLLDLLAEQPADPIQYIIDWVQFGKEQASQEAGTGLPSHRRAQLLRVFACIDKAGTGRISLDAMQKFASKYGGQALTFDELQLIFRDFKPGSDYMVSEEQFLVFFSKVSKTLINRDFDDMVAEMSQ